MLDSSVSGLAFLSLSSDGNNLLLVQDAQSAINDLNGMGGIFCRFDAVSFFIFLPLKFKLPFK